MNTLQELKALAEKWKGKDPPHMSKEWIDMRFDRIRYIKLRNKLNAEQKNRRTQFEEEQEIFK